MDKGFYSDLKIPKEKVLKKKMLEGLNQCCEI